MCDEIIDAETKSFKEEAKVVTTNFNEKKDLFLYFMCINYHYIINSC